MNESSHNLHSVLDRDAEASSGGNYEGAEIKSRTDRQAMGDILKPRIMEIKTLNTARQHYHRITPTKYHGSYL